MKAGACPLDEDQESLRNLLDLAAVGLTAGAMARTVGAMLPSSKAGRCLICAIFSLLGLAFLCPAAQAQAAAPDVMLQTVADQVIGEIRQDSGLQSSTPAKIEALVEARIVPLFDFQRMARLATARNWQLATPAQQQAITDEFRGMLVRTYASALARYSGERVEFKPLRAVALDGEVTVRSEVKQAGKDKANLDYDMIRTPAGWRIYNVKFADVCLVSTYRDIFAEKVRQGGVDGLIKFLADENSGGSSRFNTIKTSFWEKSRVMYAIFQDIFRSGLR